MNPASGIKNLLNPQHLAFETGKNITKTAIVGVIAALAVFPKLDEMAALVGTPPQQLDPDGRRDRDDDRQRAAVAYLVIAALDYVYQKHKHNKGLKMDQEEVKQEFKRQAFLPKSKSAATPEGDGGSPRAHDGRSSHRRRDRHEPHPLLRRPEVRGRKLGARSWSPRVSTASRSRSVKPPRMPA